MADPIPDTPVDRVDILRLKIEQINELVDDIRIRRERSDITLKSMQKVSRQHASITDVEPKLQRALDRAQKSIDKAESEIEKALLQINTARAHFLTLGIMEGVHIGTQDQSRVGSNTQTNGAVAATGTK